MFTLLSDFHAYIRSVLNESTDYDVFISEEVRKAARRLEASQNWRHMHKLESFVISPGTPTLDLGASIKRPEYIWTELDGDRVFYQAVEVGELAVKEESEDLPYFFWVARTLKPNWDVVESKTFNLTCWRYTDWPADTDPLPTLIQVAEDAVFHSTMARIGLVSKDQELIALHVPLAEAAISDALAAESELLIGGRYENIG